jgi:hypothetical protein
MSQLNRIVVRKEILRLTLNLFKAILIEYFLSKSDWTEISAVALHEELMFYQTISNRTVGKYLDELVEAEYLERRRHPTQKWNRTWQYRANAEKINIPTH